ncbi:DUF3857 domain-containing protein [Namhaeicola litoreus]|uniref:DUF3857 domain-containing protein n=1 Tax=Namhaeicola litoreus TaxID=1052145 RepID=A0ABW3XYX9_9FLAO
MQSKRIRLLFFLLPILTFSQNIYDISLIPEDLKKGASAVVRYDDLEVEFLAQDKMVTRVKFAITVFNKSMDDYNSLSLGFDNQSIIKKTEILIFDKEGNQIKKIKKSDFKEYAAADGFSLYNDNKILNYTYTPTQYPFTIERSYEIQTENTAFIPAFIAVGSFRTSVEKCKYQITYPADIAIQLKEINTEGYKFKKTVDNQLIRYEFENLKAIVPESLGPKLEDIAPMVKLAPNKFSLAGVDGEANNWLEFGKWYRENLLVGQNVLNPATVATVQDLVKNVDDPVEKAKRIYKYMQDKTRYISIQIGIGGWKPMPAMDVNALGYGDCKALTNYTSSLLQTVGINSYYTVIWADEKKDFDSEIPVMQGNHAILMVPFAKDTVWLECTNQKVPFGHLGNFTDDRNALVMTEEGGKIIRTKSYKAHENLQYTTGNYNIDEQGNLSAQLKIETKGAQLDDHYFTADLEPLDKERYYKKYFSEINNIKLNKVHPSMDYSNGSFLENLSFDAKKYGMNAGNRMLIRLNAFNLMTSIPRKEEDRKFPFILKMGYQDIDEVVVQIPETFRIEALPETKTISTLFGTYSLSIEKINEHEVKYTRSLTMKEGKYEAKKYEEYLEFRKHILQIDNSKIVIIKSNNS